MLKLNQVSCTLVALALSGATTAQKPVVYPAKGQSAAQQQKDDGECYTWAKGNTGVDPAAMAAAAPASAPAPAGGPRAQKKQQAAAQSTQQKTTQQQQQAMGSFNWPMAPAWKVAGTPSSEGRPSRFRRV